MQFVNLDPMKALNILYFRGYVSKGWEGKP